MNDEKGLFSFKPATSEELLRTIYSLENKGPLSYTIPVKMLKMFSGLFLPYLTGVVNHSIATSSFPDELKLVEVISAFKKDNLLDKKVYYLIPHKNLRKYFSIKSMTTWTLFYQNS